MCRAPEPSRPYIPSDAAFVLVCMLLLEAVWGLNLYMEYERPFVPFYSNAKINKVKLGGLNEVK